MDECGIGRSGGILPPRAFQRRQDAAATFNFFLAGTPRFGKIPFPI